MEWVSMFGGPAGSRDGTCFSQALPAGAPVSTQDWWRLIHLLTCINVK